MPVPIDPRADGEAFAKQYQAEQAAQKAQEAPPEPVAPWKAAAQFVTSLPDRLDLPTLEQSVARVAAPWGEAAKRVGQDVAAGVSQLVKNTGDAAVNAAEALPPGVKPTPFVAEQQQQDHAIWTHAHNALQDFTDAVKVKDPNLVDVLTQYTAQVGPAYAVYARSLGFLGGRLANLAGGAAADATALPENAPRFADMLQMAQHTDGKIGQALQAAGPYGVNLYINYLAHPAAGAEQETALEAHLKNGIDGLMPNGLGNELLHAAMVTGRQGMRVLRTGIDNGVASVGDLGPLPGSPQAQRGAVGDLGKRPPLQQGVDPAETMIKNQARADMEAAAGAPAGAKRPPLVQGNDPAQPQYDAQARADAEAAAAKVGGKIVYHGTPYDFDSFSSSQIGTGEGNQTFGYGHYFAENPATAGHYQKMLVPPTGATGVAMTDAQSAVKAAGGRAQAYAKLSQDFARSKDPEERVALQQQMSLIRSGNYNRGSGTLVHAEIANEHLDSMMHWDKPISEQPILQKVISNLDTKIVPEGNNFRVMLNGKPGGLFAEEDAAKAATYHLTGAGRSGEWNGSALYDNLATVLGSQKAASEFLSRRGIHGLKFLDQGSRDAGEGTHNIVLFNEKHAKIVKKEKANGS